MPATATWTLKNVVPTTVAPSRGAQCVPNTGGAHSTPVRPTTATRDSANPSTTGISSVVAVPGSRALLTARVVSVVTPISTPYIAKTTPQNTRNSALSPGVSVRAARISAT